MVWAEGLEPDELADDARAGDRAALVRRRRRRHAQANLLADPLAVRTRDGRPYTVFTPFWRARLAAGAPGRAAAGAGHAAAGAGRARRASRSATCAPRPCAPGRRVRRALATGRAGRARARSRTFLDGPLGDYAADRDRPDLDGSSRLSPHLHWGELTARQVWYAVGGALAEAGLDLEAAVGPPSWDEEQAPGLRRSAGAFLRQLGWREFGHHLLAAFPHTVTRPLHERFAALPLARRPGRARGLAARPHRLPDRRRGHARSSGRPAGCTTACACSSASFLVKDLLLPWQDGAAWFWDTLVDADLANNTLGWQWVAGCGADAAPYFRVFNPVTQGRRFDRDGAYVRRWVPELAGLPAERGARSVAGAGGAARARRRHARRDVPGAASWITARPALARARRLRGRQER